MKSAISSCFERLRAEGRCALMPFLTAGDPNLATTRAALLALQEAGADLVELGIPYSDPLADGPVIQAAAGRALAAGTTLAGVLELLSSLKGELELPVVLFTYSNPLLNCGMESFCQQAAAAGAAGLLVPDLPLEEAERLSPIAAAAGLDLVLLVAPHHPTATDGPHRCSQQGLYLFGECYGCYGGTQPNGNKGCWLSAANQGLRFHPCGGGIWHLRGGTSCAGARLGRRWRHRW